MDNSNATTQYDPQAVAMVRALKMQESGNNYNAPAEKAGQSLGGAYQYQAPTWHDYAQQVLGDPNAPFTPQNQDKVTYGMVKQWKDAGQSPEQIAHNWNPGSPNYPKEVVSKLKLIAKGELAPTTPTGANGGFVNPKVSAPISNFVTPPVQTSITESATGTPQNKGFLNSLVSGAQDIGKSIASPILGVASLPFQTGLAGYNAITGQHIADPTQQGGIPIFGLGNTSVTPLDLEKKAGDIAQVAGMAMPGSGILGTIGQGALVGGGQALSQGGDVGTVLGNTAIGAGLGGAVGGATKIGGELLKGLGGNISGNAAEEAMQGMKNAYGKALNLSAGERDFENRSGKDLAQVLLDNKAPLGRYENGTLDASIAIEKLQPKLEQLNNEASTILEHPQGVVKNISLNDIFNDVKGRINASKIPATQAKQMITQAQGFLNDEASRFGNEVAPNIANEIKQGFQNSVFRKATASSADKLSNNVQYLISDSLKDATEKAIAGTDAGNVLGEINSQRSDLIDAIKRLTKMDGVKLLKGGKLGNMAGGLIGTMVGGSTGNPLMALGGDYFGTRAAEFLNNPATRIGIAEAKGKIAGILPKLLGQTSKPIGGAISQAGNIVSRLPRVSGLIGQSMLGGNRGR